MQDRKRRLGAWLAAILLAVSGGLVFSASPAQAWGYCSPTVGTAGLVNFYAEQGYCYPRVAFSIPSGTMPRCLDLRYTTVGDVTDYAGSVWNRTSKWIRLFPARSCSGEPNATLAPNTSHPDLTRFQSSSGAWVYHNHASVMFWNP